MATRQAATRLRVAPREQVFPTSLRRSCPHPSRARLAPTNPTQSSGHFLYLHRRWLLSALPANQLHIRLKQSVSPPSQTDFQAQRSFPREELSLFRMPARQSLALRPFAQFFSRLECSP